MAGPPKAPEPQGGEADGKFTWRQVYQKPDIAGMSALSRREEEALVKDAKAHARDVCREFVKGSFSPFLTLSLPLMDKKLTISLSLSMGALVSAAYADCVEPRLVSVLWACRGKQEEMNACLRPLFVPPLPSFSWSFPSQRLDSMV